MVKMACRFRRSHWTGKTPLTLLSTKSISATRRDPPKFGANVTVSSVDVTNLQGNTLYYWYVVATDGTNTARSPATDEKIFRTLGSFDFSFDSTIHISDTDTTYENLDVLVDGATVTIDGSHTFKSLQVINDGVVTHNSTDTTTEFRLELSITNQVYVSSGSTINVSSRGYTEGRTVGNTTTGAATGSAGGSYGGYGYNMEGTGNEPNGDFTNPNELGSGAGPNGTGGRGGGLVRITAASLILDGNILANGESRSGNYEGGGSGGGIYLDVDTLNGSGTIQAMGGNGRYHSSVSGADGGSGGGGRIAIYYVASTFPFDNVSVRGGSQSRSRNGGSGTIYLKKDSDPRPELIFDNDNISATGATVTKVWFGVRNDPSDDPANTNFLNIISRDKARVWFETTPTVVTADTVQLSNGDLFVDKLRCTTADILNGAVLYSLITRTTEEHFLDLNVTGTLTVDSTSLISVSNCGYLEGRTQGNSTTGAATGSAGGSYWWIWLQYGGCA